MSGFEDIESVYMGRRIHWRRTLVDKVALAHPQTPFISRCETHMKPSGIVRAWVEACNRADAEALAGFYADDAVNHQVANEPVVGRMAIHKMFAEEFARAEMCGIVERIFEIDDWAILEWRDPLGLRGCGFFQVLDDKIVFQRGYWDKLSFLRLHGLPIPDRL